MDGRDSPLCFRITKCSQPSVKGNCKQPVSALKSVFIVRGAASFLFYTRAKSLSLNLRFSFYFAVHIKSETYLGSVQVICKSQCWYPLREIVCLPDLVSVFFFFWTSIHGYVHLQIHLTSLLSSTKQDHVFFLFIEMNVTRRKHVKG